MHPLLTDIPIGSWIAAATLDLPGSGTSPAAARRLVGFGTLAAIPAALAGAPDWADTYVPEQRDGLVHALANLTGVSLQAASYLVRCRGKTTAGIALSADGLALTAAAWHSSIFRLSDGKALRGRPQPPSRYGRCGLADGRVQVRSAPG